MINYAELDQDNKVVNVFVVDPEVFATDEIVIATFSNDSLPQGHTIVNATQNNKAGIGNTYDTAVQVFVHEKPEDNPSFIWDSSAYFWIAPVPKPASLPAAVNSYVADDESNERWGWDWNEELVQWECIYHGETTSEEESSAIALIEASISPVS